MNAPLTTHAGWEWPADVLTLAAEQGVTEYLQPLLDTTRRLFPTARSLTVSVNEDPEIRDMRTIVFDVRVPQADVPDFVSAVHRWTDELFRCCPAPLVTVFCLLLDLVA